MNTSQDSPGSDMAPITDQDGNIMHTAPTVRNSLYVDLPRIESGSLRSAAGTPTPPSTPGSKRRDPMTTSYNSRSNGASPSSTPKLSRRFDTRTYSGDSQGIVIDCSGGGGGASSAGLPLKEENLQRLEELCGRDSAGHRHLPGDECHNEHCTEDDRVSDTEDGGSSMHVSGRLAHRHHHQHHQNHYHPGSAGDDSVDKCNRWLQSLKLNKSDKIKSRSHIQLPPI
ncbi:unnamed protein product [Lymnaea stagnalis]|uniref:Uncharacterized protein n=1 Tax=Lymnaea stagnalis TaxID=6523 RepID=A0AAV2IRQ4_LYMST